MFLKKLAVFIFLLAPCLLTAQKAAAPARIAGHVLDPQGHPVSTSDKAYPSRLSGTVVDTSGAVFAGATVQVKARTVLYKERQH